MRQIKVNDDVKVTTPGEDNEFGVVTQIENGMIQVEVTTKRGTIHTVWFNADGTEYRERYGSVIHKVFDAYTEDNAEPWTAEEFETAAKETKVDRDQE